MLKHTPMGIVAAASTLVVIACDDRKAPVAPTAESVVAEPDDEPRAHGIEDFFDAVAREWPRFAGHYRENDGTLVVLSTDQDPAHHAEAVLDDAADVVAGHVPAVANRTAIRHERVEFSYRQLQSFASSIRTTAWDDRIRSLDVDEAQNQVHVGVEDEGEIAGVRNSLTAAGIPDRALRVSTLRKPTTRQTLRDEFTPVKGGVLIDHSFGGAVAVCTLAMNAHSGSHVGFVTNSHCSERIGDGSDGASYWQTAASGRFVGSEFADPWFTYNSTDCQNGCRYSDANFVEYSGPYSVKGYIARTEHPLGSITIDGNNAAFLIDEDPVFLSVGDEVHKVGQKTGWTMGTVSATCQNHYDVVDDATGEVYSLLCQDHADLESDGGDSGAPVFAFVEGQDEYVRVAGILWGGPDGSTSTTYYSRWTNVDFEVGGELVGSLDIAY